MCAVRSGFRGQPCTFHPHPRSCPWCTPPHSQVGASSITTKTIDNDLNPVWDERHDFFFYSPEQCVSVKLYDSDVGPDDFLGRVPVPTPSPLRQDVP